VKKKIPKNMFHIHTYEKETYIIKLLKNSSTNPAFHTTNTITDHLLLKPQKRRKYNKARVYKLKCKTCPPQHTCQTDRTFETS
jgi:hypothetical protein